MKIVILRHSFALAATLLVTLAHVVTAEPLQPEAADPSLSSLRLSNPTKVHLTAERLYEGQAAHESMREKVGQFVLLDVVIEIAGPEPLVQIELAGQVPDVNHRLRAHLVNWSGLSTKPPVQGSRARLEGIIVNEGYGAYMIYLSALQYLGAKGE